MMGEPDQDPQVTTREIKLSAEIARLRAEVERLTRELGDLAELAGKQAAKLTEAEAVVRAAEAALVYIDGGASRRGQLIELREALAAFRGRA